MTEVAVTSVYDTLLERGFVAQCSDEPRSISLATGDCDLRQLTRHAILVTRRDERDLRLESLGIKL